MFVQVIILLAVLVVLKILLLWEFLFISGKITSRYKILVLHYCFGFILLKNIMKQTD